MSEFRYAIIHTVEVDENQMPKHPAAINGGMMKRTAPIENPVVTISVTDINETLRKIEETGGETISEKRQVGEIGFAAYFKDPEGNILGLWENIKK